MPIPQLTYKTKLRIKEETIHKIFTKYINSLEQQCSVLAFKNAELEGKFPIAPAFIYEGEAYPLYANTTISIELNESVLAEASALVKHYLDTLEAKRYSEHILGKALAESSDIYEVLIYLPKCFHSFTPIASEILSKWTESSSSVPKEKLVAFREKTQKHEDKVKYFLLNRSLFYTE